MTEMPENWPQGRRPLLGCCLPYARLVPIRWQGGHFKNDLPVSYTVRAARNNGLRLNRSCNGMSYVPSDIRCKARRTELPRYYSSEMAINMLLWRGFYNAQAVAHGAEAHIVSVFTHFVFMNVFFWISFKWIWFRNEIHSLQKMLERWSALLNLIMT